MIAFHRFLIVTAILFCLGFGVWSLLAFEAGAGTGTLVLGVIFVALAAGLGYYLNHLRQFLKL